MKENEDQKHFFKDPKVIMTLIVWMVIIVIYGEQMKAGISLNTTIIKELRIEHDEVKRLNRDVAIMQSEFVHIAEAQKLNDATRDLVLIQAESIEFIKETTKEIKAELQARR